MSRIALLAAAALLILFGIVIGIRMGTSSPPAATRATPLAPAPPPVTGVPVSLAALDAVMQDETRTELQRNAHLQSLQGRLVIARGEVFEVYAATRSSPIYLSLLCLVPSGPRQRANVLAKMRPEGAPALLAVQKGQIVTVQGEAESFERPDRPLFGGAPTSNGRYALRDCRLYQEPARTPQ